MGYRPKYACACPFYDREYVKGICCEGMAGASENIIMFKSENEKIAWIKKYCIHEFPEDCKLYKILNEKYEEGNETHN